MPNQVSHALCVVQPNTEQQRQVDGLSRIQDARPVHSRRATFSVPVELSSARWAAWPDRRLRRLSCGLCCSDSTDLDPLVAAQIAAFRKANSTAGSLDLKGVPAGALDAGECRA